MSEFLSSGINLDLLPPSSQILNQVAEDVSVEEIRSHDIQALIDGMARIAHGEQGDAERKTMVGLAAPQVGVSKRVILVAAAPVFSGAPGELQAYINPVIVAVSSTTEEDREGCYSTAKVCGIVERAFRVTIDAYDRHGNRVHESFEGFPARIFQHEIDHLDGIRFPDRITDDSKLHWVEPERYGEYRERWAEWDTPCPRGQWEAIKAGTFEAST